MLTRHCPTIALCRRDRHHLRLLLLALPLFRSLCVCSSNCSRLAAARCFVSVGRHSFTLFAVGQLAFHRLRTAANGYQFDKRLKPVPTNDFLLKDDDGTSKYKTAYTHPLLFQRLLCYFSCLTCPVPASLRGAFAAICSCRSSRILALAASSIRRCCSSPSSNSNEPYARGEPFRRPAGQIGGWVNAGAGLRQILGGRIGVWRRRRRRTRHRRPSSSRRNSRITAGAPSTRTYF